jgi:hypothetical protein
MMPCDRQSRAQLGLELWVSVSPGKSIDGQDLFYPGDIAEGTAIVRLARLVWSSGLSRQMITMGVHNTPPSQGTVEQHRIELIDQRDFYIKLGFEVGTHAEIDLRGTTATFWAMRWRSTSTA